eukprot:TRINITY_DN33632_c0_g1_i1.p1 TRINITY_DN33632_c0_g1~~TRINITY_DN33632_c0_g1_i1.p1  ORF type:complete len:381 (-),score=70.21 TRINITY_DN33632_c0_g1_i1:35-1177(-)
MGFKMESHLMAALMIVLASSSVTALKGEANVTRMREALTQHFSKSRHHVTNPSYKQAAMTFIRDQFREMGLEAHLHLFPTVLDNVTGINVIGLLKGRHFNTANDSIVGIGAHYDTMRDTPGVDDNGAAVVVMLEAARVLSKKPDRENTILFIAFDFEEWEDDSILRSACQSISCGSKALVAHWLPNFFPSPLQWKGIFVMDTIMNFNQTQASQKFPEVIGQVFPSQAADIQSDGSRGDFLMIAGRSEDKGLLDSFHKEWLDKSQKQYEIEEFTIPQPILEFSNFLRSDHAPFWLGGLDAIFITDTADFRGYMKKCYHKYCDTIERVTPSMMTFAATTCHTLIAVLDDLSPVAPATTSAGHVGSTPVLGSLLLTAAVLMYR